jgi:dihydroorotate dehydrogenase (NAD+) catalytic subunit
VKAMTIDIESAVPVLGNIFGGYSGPVLMQIGVRCVYELSSLPVPVIGVGGILTGNDVIEYMLAGASAVQIGSGVYYRGKEIFSAVSQEIKEWLTQHGYTAIQQIVGLATQLPR